MTIHVTQHAAQRYQERVNPALSLEQATAAIYASDRALSVAAAFRCGVVRLGCGAKLILEGATVVTVLPARALPRQLRGALA